MQFPPAGIIRLHMLCLYCKDMHTIDFCQGTKPKNVEKLKYQTYSDLTWLRGRTDYFEMGIDGDCNTFKAHRSLSGLPTICILIVIY